MAGVTGATGGTAPAREVHWLDQVHGSRVVAVHPRVGPEGAPGAPGTGAVCAGTGDALVTDSPGCALSVLTADCASIALGSEEGVFGAVHAGWRGLVAGVVERAVAVMREMGATGVAGALGPCIHPDCYEFSDADLAGVVAVLGDGVRSTSAAGRPALDLPAAVSAALATAGVREVAGQRACTACSAGYFSHRARRDTGRQALVVWSAVPGEPR